MIAYGLALLVPLAFVSGWLLARRDKAGREHATHHDSLSSDYFRGLNYLLNEQQDKAIEVFVRLVEDDGTALETHMLLGNLFRRRGEVNRAIRIHESLVARSQGNDAVRTAALLELGDDYLRAGLLDRAETLFLDLVSMHAHVAEALRNLVSIYQHERDWHEAINHARKLEAASGESQAHIIAHFYCELAEQALQHGAQDAAGGYLDQAERSEPNNVRPYMVRGRMLAAAGRPAAAMDALEAAIELQPDYVPEIVPRLLECYRAGHALTRGNEFLQHVQERYRGISLTLALANLRFWQDDHDGAVTFLKKSLAERPSVRGTLALLDATIDQTSDETYQNLKILRHLANDLLEEQARYRCTHCGFSAKGHYWQCPGCKQWGTVRPIRGPANE